MTTVDASLPQFKPATLFAKDFDFVITDDAVQAEKERKEAALLEMLQDGKKYTGPQLREGAGIEKTQIGTYFDKIRRRGYEIKSKYLRPNKVPHLFYWVDSDEKRKHEFNERAIKAVGDICKSERGDSGEGVEQEGIAKGLADAKSTFRKNYQKSRRRVQRRGQSDSSDLVP